MIFRNYAKLGQKLIELHLLKNLPNDADVKVKFSLDYDRLKEFVIKNKTVPTATSNQLIIEISNKETITFLNVNKEICDFEIGSYRPIDKWISYRIKDEVSLNFEDVNHVKNMIIAIKHTILVIKEIENLQEGYLKGA